MQDNDIEIDSAHHEGRLILAEQFIRTLENKIYKYMTVISKNVYLEKLFEIVKKYNNTIHWTIKMKIVIFKPDTHVDFPIEFNITK